MEQQNTQNYDLCQKLYESYHKELFGFCVSKVREREEAFDLIQDVFVKLWSILQSGQTIEKPRAFLYSMLRNKIIDQYRSVALQRVFPLSDELMNTLAIDTSEMIDQTELRIILQTINTLPESQREVLLYRYIDGLPVSDIADMFDTTPNAISQRIKRGISAVQKQLSLDPTS
jgi:RNA polymerase sigma-70 factor (ECF subfamily)